MRIRVVKEITWPGRARHVLVNASGLRRGYALRLWGVTWLVVAARP